MREEESKERKKSDIVLSALAVNRDRGGNEGKKGRMTSSGSNSTITAKGKGGGMMRRREGALPSFNDPDRGEGVRRGRREREKGRRKGRTFSINKTQDNSADRKKKDQKGGDKKKGGGRKNIGSAGDSKNPLNRETHAREKARSRGEREEEKLDLNFLLSHERQSRR